MTTKAWQVHSSKARSGHCSYLFESSVPPYTTSVSKWPGVCSSAPRMKSEWGNQRAPENFPRTHPLSGVWWVPHGAAMALPLWVELHTQMHVHVHVHVHLSPSPASSQTSSHMLLVSPLTTQKTQQSQKSTSGAAGIYLEPGITCGLDISMICFPRLILSIVCYLAWFLHSS